MADAAQDKLYRFDEVLNEELALLEKRRRWIWEQQADQTPFETGAGATSTLPPPPPDAGPATAAIDAQKTARLQALKQHYTGLALSGGGIRSATFALGVLQGLASLKLLNRFDYLSTVSGGGYIGGWYAAWLKREKDVTAVEMELSPSRIDQGEVKDREIIQNRIVDEEPEPVHHLRSYSNYLTPRPGLLSVDTWTVLSIYVRNSLINFLFLLPITVILVLGARGLVKFYDIPPTPRKAATATSALSWIITPEWGVIGAMVGLLLFAFVVMARQIAMLRGAKHQDATGTQDPGISLLWFHLLVILPLVAVAVLVTWSFGLEPVHPPSWGQVARGDSAVMLRLPEALDFLQPEPDNSLLPESVSNWLTDSPIWTRNTLTYWKANPGTFLWISALELGLVLGTMSLAAHLLGSVIYRVRKQAHPDPAPTHTGLGHFALLLLAVWLAGFSGGFLLIAVLSHVIWPLHDQPYALLVLGPPLILMVIVTATYIQVWLVNRRQGAEVREWWSRFAALMVIYAMAWFTFFGVVLYGPLLIHMMDGTWIKSSLTGGWLLTTVSGAFFGHRASVTKGTPSFFKRILIQLAPPVFVLGLLVLVAVGVNAVIDTPPTGIDPDKADRAALYWSGITSVHGKTLVAVLAVAVLAVVLAGLMTDVNLFSLNEMYANRLTRAYLGASRPKQGWVRRWSRDPGGESQEGGAPTANRGKVRRSNAITGFDPDDDLPLWALQLDEDATRDYDQAKKTQPYRGPMLLINTSLNLVAGKELAWQDRKAESFSLTPHFCGSKGTGFVRTTRRTEDVLTLGRAMAISGAAVDSNIGLHQSSALIALMTVLNARLGWWLKNPKRFRGWDAAGPSVGWPLVGEMLGMTDANQKYVHLSDGGHFENLAVYELIRRRCRYIVCTDAGTDPGASDDNLANLIRLCRTDFGVRIEIDTAPLKGEGAEEISRWHCVVGKIRYDDVDGGELPGIFVLLRAGLTGDEPPDIQEYAAKNPTFPRQSTLDQFFDERQFESYRALGFHVATRAFTDPLSETEEISSIWQGSSLQDVFARNNQRLFSAVQKRWAPVPGNMTHELEDASAGWISIQKMLRSGDGLHDLSRDVYPELSDGPPIPLDNAPAPAIAAASAPETARAELHAVAQMLQVMEDAWIGLKVRGFRDLPLNRGWMSFFRRWAGTAAFRRYWPTLRVEYSQGFIRFCEDQLRLRVVTDIGRYERFDATDQFLVQAVDRLGREFAREWPLQPPLREILGAGWDATDPASKRFRPLWLITQAPLNGSDADRHVCGVVTLWRDRHDDEHELFAWIERPYRSIGIGSHCAKTFLKEIQERYLDPPGPGQVTIRVRFPKEGWKTPQDMEFGLWRNFYSHYDFAPTPGEKLNRPTGRDVLLKKTYLLSQKTPDRPGSPDP